MFQLLQPQARVAAFASACLMALLINGAVLLGADRLAQNADAAMMVNAHGAATLVASKESRRSAL